MTICACSVIAERAQIISCCSVTNDNHAYLVTCVRGAYQDVRVPVIGEQLAVRLVTVGYETSCVASVQLPVCPVQSGVMTSS